MNNSSHPEFSICVTTYNRPESLLKTVESLLSQTFSSLEIIIIDDYSTDKRYENIVQDLPNDKRITYFRNPTNLGLASSRNVAIGLSKGRFFTFCDDDDIWQSHYLHSVYSVICENDFEIMVSQKISHKPVKGFKGQLIQFILAGFTPPVGMQIYNIATLGKALKYNPIIKSGVDHDLWISIGATTQARVIWINEDYIEFNSNFDLNRMTMNYDLRYNRVMSSIIKWQGLYNDYYPENFFDKLKKNYTFHIRKTVFVSKLKSQYSFDLRLFLLLIKDIPIIIRFIIKKYRINRKFELSTTFDKLSKQANTLIDEF